MPAAPIDYDAPEPDTVDHYDPRALPRDRTDLHARQGLGGTDQQLGLAINANQAAHVLESLALNVLAFSRAAADAGWPLQRAADRLAEVAVGTPPTVTALITSLAAAGLDRCYHGPASAVGDPIVAAALDAAARRLAAIDAANAADARREQAREDARRKRAEAERQAEDDAKFSKLEAELAAFQEWKAGKSPAPSSK